MIFSRCTPTMAVRAACRSYSCTGWPAEVIEGTGHWLHLDRPEQFNRILDDFLANTLSA